MRNLIKEHKELFKNQLIDYINEQISSNETCMKRSIESCDINYFKGSLDSLMELKNYIKEM